MDKLFLLYPPLISNLIKPHTNSPLLIYESTNIAGKDAIPVFLETNLKQNAYYQ